MKVSTLNKIVSAVEQGSLTDAQLLELKNAINGQLASQQTCRLAGSRLSKVDAEALDSEIVRCIVNNYANYVSEVARMFNVSRQTVIAHRRAILSDTRRVDEYIRVLEQAKTDKLLASIAFDPADV